jgi:deoxyribodipyrimidine photo-lyase
LAEFVPRAGRAYAAKRNYDLGSADRTNVSQLSPYMRHRLITEAEVTAAVLQTHSIAAAEKFIQEVCWRTYWKGWLEQRPQVWSDYLDEVQHQKAVLRADDARAAEFAAAARGDTGIACFDAWAQELAATGYLHNHARMWFASIWIFTLRLPWALGADLFYRQLLDGDPASNTLSWRWVAGLHTRGKTYLARADNIATYTAGRFQPPAEDLAAFAQPLDDAGDYERVPLRVAGQVPRGTRIVLLVTEEDLTPETWSLDTAEVAAVAIMTGHDAVPNFAPLVRAFKAAALADTHARATAYWRAPVTTVASATELVALVRTSGATHGVTAQAPIGWVQAELAAWQRASAAAGVPLIEIARPWDSLFWPHAKAGFFQLKDRIPTVLGKLGITPSNPKSQG